MKKATQTRLRNEIAGFYGKLANFDRKNIEFYDTEPEASAFVYMSISDFRGRVDMDFLKRLIEHRFYDSHYVTRYSFGFSDDRQMLVMHLSIKRRLENE